MNKELVTVFFDKTSVALSILELKMDENGIPTDYDMIFINQSFHRLFPNSIQSGKLSLNTQEDQDVLLNACIAALRQDEITKFNQYSDIYAKLFLFEITRIDTCHVAVRAKDITISFLREEDHDIYSNVNVDMLCVTNHAGYFLSISQELQAILGYHHNELVGKKVLDYIHKEDLESSVQAMKEIRTGKVITNFINRYRCFDNSYRYLEWRAKFKGNYVYSSARDVNDMINTQEQLKKANETLLKHSLEIERVNRSLQTLSTTDALTGIYNRYYINNRLNEESKRMHRYHTPFSMIFFDLDHFKTINDTYGHMVGDDILKITAEIAKKVIRTTDVLGRWGGEEFLVIAPHTVQKDAVILAEKLRIAIENHEHPMVGQFTCSFGVVQRHENETLKDVYERVDDALYHAKSDGRNKVYTATLKEHMPIGSVYLEWNETLYSGNKIIDQQHQEIMKISNQLISMILSSDDSRDIELQMIALFEFIKLHFDTEELILTEIGYPNISDHLKEHSRLIKKGQQFLSEHNSQQLSPTSFFAYIVDDVVFGHLIKDDHQYYPYLFKSDNTSKTLTLQTKDKNDK